jgi:anti-anti-sigma factor
MPAKPVSSDSSQSRVQADAPTFDCTMGHGGRGEALVRLAGELDAGAAPRLAQTLREATRRARLVVVDLRGLTGVSVAGVAALVSASRSARTDGRRLVLVRGLSQVERLLAVTGSSADVELIELAAGQPTVVALSRIARADRGDKRAFARAPRRVVSFLGSGQIARGIDTMIERGVRADILER